MTPEEIEDFTKRFEAGETTQEEELEVMTKLNSIVTDLRKQAEQIRIKSLQGSLNTDGTK